MRELIDAILIIEKKKNKKGFTAWVEINGVKKPFSRFTFSDDSLNGQPCKVDKQLTKVIVNGKTYPPEPKAQNQNKQSRQTNSHQQQRYQNQNRNQPQQAYSQTNNGEENNMPDSVDINQTKLPKDTKDIGFKDIDNYALKLNKAARFDDSEQKFKFFNVDRKDKNKSFQIKAEFKPELIDKTTKSMQLIEKSYKDQGYKIAKLPPMKSDWRLIVGLGNESVYETSMTLHHIYGIPYIPGSAVKGVLRSYMITENFDSYEQKALQDKEFCDFFGCPKESYYKEERQGKVIFFDAFPTEPPTIEPDIMNPHYGDYYSDKKDSSGNPIPPADYLSPNPIFFLTVKGAEFDFYLGMKPKYYSEDKVLLGKAEEWLKEALTTHGIGAKTAVGYGYFN